jgi:hypothetical protein
VLRRAGRDATAYHAASRPCRDQPRRGLVPRRARREASANQIGAGPRGDTPLRFAGRPRERLLQGAV